MVLPSHKARQAPPNAAAVYVRHRPETTLLYQIVQEYWPERYTDFILSWFASKTGNIQFLNEELFMLTPEERGRISRLAGAGLVWTAQFEEKKAKKIPQAWKGEGANPIVVFTGGENNSIDGGAVLTQGDKELKLENLSHPEFAVSVVSLYPPPHELDKQIEGLKRLEINIPAWTIKNDKSNIQVRLSGN